MAHFPAAANLVTKEMVLNVNVSALIIRDSDRYVHVVSYRSVWFPNRNKIAIANLNLTLKHLERETTPYCFSHRRVSSMDLSVSKNRIFHFS